LSALNREHGIVSAAGVLIGPEDTRWGALCVLSSKKRQFSVDDVNFLQAVANVLSGAIARARAEEDVRLPRARLSGILDNADDAIISVDQTQKITMFNHGAEKIFGYTAQEVMGQPLGMLMPARFMQVHQEHVGGFGAKAVVARRMGERSEIFGRRKDGTEFPAEASISKIEAPGAMIFTAILRDITERKRAEAVLEARVAERTAELRTEIAQREAAQEALVRSQKLQGLGELAGGMAHDFNNLLTVITGNLEFLDTQLKDKTSWDLIQRADEAARMGARLIGRLLTFGRQRKLIPEVVNLNEIALGMTEILRRSSASRSCSMPEWLPSSGARASTPARPRLRSSTSPSTRAMPCRRAASLSSRPAMSHCRSQMRPPPSAWSRGFTSSWPSPTPARACRRKSSPAPSSRSSRPRSRARARGWGSPPSMGSPSNRAGMRRSRARWVKAPR
jgi:PAS domain S-box-containing protein